MTAMMAKNTSKSVVSSSDESDSGSPKRKNHRHDRFKTERRVHFFDQKTVIAREEELKAKDAESEAGENDHKVKGLSFDYKVKEDDRKGKGNDYKVKEIYCKVKQDDHRVKEDDCKVRQNDYKVKENERKVNENILTVKEDIKERIKRHKHKKHKKHKHKSVDLDFSNGSTVLLKTPVEYCFGSLDHKSNDNTTASSSSPYNVEASCSNYCEMETKLCDSDKQCVYGPSLPPCFMNTADIAFGPALPPKLKLSNEGTNLPYREKVFGPSLPPKLLPNTEESQFSDNEDFVGPVPEGFIDLRERTSIIQHQLTSRADYLRTQLAKEAEKGEDDKTQRETWMLELPPEKSSIVGLGPRTFRRREGPEMGDRSVWTDTPEMKIKRETEGKKGEEKKVRLKSEAVLATEKAVEEYLARSSSKHRTKSLLEMHQEKRKKKLKETSEYAKHVRCTSQKWRGYEHIKLHARTAIMSVGDVLNWCYGTATDGELHTLNATEEDINKQIHSVSLPKDRFNIAGTGCLFYMYML